jgi:hypothetical protein
VLEDWEGTADMGETDGMVGVDTDVSSEYEGDNTALQPPRGVYVERNLWLPRSAIDRPGMPAIPDRSTELKFVIRNGPWIRLRTPARLTWIFAEEDAPSMICVASRREHRTSPYTRCHSDQDGTTGG